MTAAPRALIAEDEPLLARALERALAQAWPELTVVARAADGPSAIEAALTEQPDVLFLDIQLPGANGLEVAAEVADDWPEDQTPPLLVFVTAFDHYALAAFERAAVDYLLKPVTADRLAQTVARLRERLGSRSSASGRGASAALLRSVQMAGEVAAPATSNSAAAEKIRVIRAAEGQRVRMIALADVVCLEAADKYVNVVTETGSVLVRLSLRELAARIEGVEFVQVHRSVLVNAQRIAGAERDEAGHYWLQLRGLKRPLKVSRAFSHLFRPM